MKTIKMNEEEYDEYQQLAYSYRSAPSQDQELVCYHFNNLTNYIDLMLMRHELAIDRTYLAESKEQE